MHQLIPMLGNLYKAMYFRHRLFWCWRWPWYIRWVPALVNHQGPVVLLRSVPPKWNCFLHLCSGSDLILAQRLLTHPKLSIKETVTHKFPMVPSTNTHAHTQLCIHTRHRHILCLCFAGSKSWWKLIKRSSIFSSQLFLYFLHHRNSKHYDIIIIWIVVVMFMLYSEQFFCNHFFFCNTEILMISYQRVGRLSM